jgi:hypothetical protein
VGKKNAILTNGWNGVFFYWMILPATATATATTTASTATAAATTITTTAAAATATTSMTTATTAALLRFVHFQCTTLEFLAVQILDRS